MTEDDMVARLQRLMVELDEAKKSIEITTRHVSRAREASDASRRHASLLDTSRKLARRMKKKRRSGRNPAASLLRERIAPETLARLQAISQVQKRSVVAVLDEALAVYERRLRARKRKGLGTGD